MPVSRWEWIGGIGVWVVAPAIFLGPLWVACVALQAAVIGALLVLSNFTRP